MKLRYILSMVAIVAATTNSFAQYSQDALRFSTTQTGSTSRIKAIGNANVAIGGDLTSVSGNPAGLGFFTKSEFSITPEYNMFKAKSTYFGDVTNDKKNTGNLSNAAVVFYQRLTRPPGADKTKGWLSVNYGLGYSRTNDFYENTSYGGNNPNTSITDYYADRANSSNNDLLADWAYDHRLIDLYKIDPDLPDDAPNNLEYRSNADFTNGVGQRNVITRTGGQSEFNIAIGANHSNKLYIGGSLGMTSIRYNSTVAYSENGGVFLENDAPANNFNSVYTQNQTTRGTGFNAKLGLIYKPVEAVRLGFNFTTPTWYNMQDTYSEGLATNISGNSNYRSGPQVYGLEYNLTTPLKVAGGVAVFIKQFGFITGDIEYVDYGSANLSSNDSFDATFDNNDIKTFYKGAVNARVGAEARLGRFAYLRGGYNVQGNPMKENGSTIKTASGGLGFRSGSYSVDATYTHATGRQTLFPYEIGDLSPSASINRSNDNVYLTLSYRF